MLKKMIVISCSLLILLFTGVYSKALYKEDVESIRLKVEPKHSEDYIRLDWESDGVQLYIYKAYKQVSGVGEYESISMIDLDNPQKIRVLNLYPVTDIMPMISFETWDGEHVTLPKSASLKQWMEEPNAEHEKGYGQGIIEVDAVSLEEFNASPSTYIGEPSNYKYDSVYIGAWDSNGNSEDLTESSAQALLDFSDSGRGVLLGHDTLGRDGYGNITRMYNYFGNTLGISFNGVTTVGQPKVFINKKSIFTSFPWNIGDVGDVLNIPHTHTQSNSALEDNTFLKFQVDKPGEDGTINGNKIIEDGTYTNRWFLSIKGNIGAIQTGHSNGNGSIHEQKILANTLFYLNQMNTVNYVNDRSGQDISEPEIPIIKNSYLSNAGDLVFDINGVADIGTKYSYYIEATGQDDGLIKESNKVETEIKSGLKGYSYVIDDKEDTEPDNSIDISGNSLKLGEHFDKGELKQYYLHIKSIDNATNFSETHHYKITIPSVEDALDAVVDAESLKNSISIGIARNLVNNLPECYIKGELQNRLNEIIEIVDIVFEKYNTTSNLDVYIKSQNMLSLSLNSNSVSFEDFNGTEDLLQDGALELSINSSLPYEINAYIQEEIQNADKSETMDKSILNLKESSDSGYKEFTDIKTRLNLLAHSDAGNNKTHTFDFKLNGGIAHKKDVYKATIKFEVKQK